MRGSLTIGVIGGGGWLGGALASSLLDSGLLQSQDLSLSYRGQKPPRDLGAFWTADNQQLCDRSDVVIFCVRPVDWPSLAVDCSGKLVVSVMAGICLEQLARNHKTDRVIRALPNAAAEVRQSYTPWIASAGATVADRALTRQIFQACGVEDEVTGESDIDYLTGLTGSGPAFPALLAAAMMQDAVRRGISPDVARRCVNAVLVGTGRLVELRSECPQVVVETFMDYRGTTAAALETMRSAGFESAVRDGLAAALRKSVSMGQSS
jgi:pyrroline-5-carboxylate reductase